MALPLLPLAIGVGFTLLAWAWSSVTVLRSHTSVNLANRSWRLGFMCKDSTQVYEYFLTWMEFGVPFLNIVYNSLCTKCFDAFSCFQLADGTLALNVAPDLACWDSAEHRAMVGVAILGLLIYVLGIPAYVLSTMLYGMLEYALGVTWRRGRSHGMVGMRTGGTSSKTQRSCKYLGFCTTNTVSILRLRSCACCCVFFHRFRTARRARVLHVGAYVSPEALCVLPLLGRLSSEPPCSSSKLG
jgi:hypothetical protein